MIVGHENAELAVPTDRAPRLAVEAGASDGDDLERLERRADAILTTKSWADLLSTSLILAGGSGKKTEVALVPVRATCYEECSSRGANRF